MRRRRLSNWDEHEILDDTVETRALVTKAELFAFGILASSEGAEVLHGFGDGLSGLNQATFLYGPKILTLP